MFRTTDAMIKAVQVQNKKEMLASHIDALNKATLAGNKEIAAVISEMVAVAEMDVAASEDMLINPSY